jgi:hypothetical protein
MRPPVYDLYEMKSDRLPDGIKAAWLRTWPDEQPTTDGWTLVGRERHPSRLTIAEMNKRGYCYRDIPNWIDSSKWYNKS